MSERPSRMGGSRRKDKGASNSNTRASSVRSSRLGDKASRMGAGGDGHDKGQRIIVRDKNGNDVTPLSLVSMNPTVLKKHGKKGDLEGTDATASTMISSGQTTPTSETEGSADNFDRMSFGDFTRSGLTSRGSDTPTGDMSFDAGMDDEDGASEKKEIVKHVEEEVKVELTEEDLEKDILVTLSETDTVWLLELTGTCVDINNDQSGAAAVTKRNEEYEEIKKAKQGSDLFVERAMQTFNNALKNKDVQCNPPAVRNAEVSATSWDIFDTIASMQEDETDEFKLGELPSEAQKKKKKAAELAARSGRHKPVTQLREDQVLQGEEAMKAMESLANNESLLHSLHIVERAVAQNHYHDKHLSYRNYKSTFAVQPDETNETNIADLTDEKPEEQPEDADDHEDLQKLDEYTMDEKHSLEYLWSFEANNEYSTLTHGHNVSSMAWNRYNQDLLAVSYGSFDFVTHSKEGLILFWSLKNPNYPERVYKTHSGVTALSFSYQHPNLLAAGMYDGTVAIYDLRKSDDKPALESGHASGKHSDPVWQLQWVNKGAEIGEQLVSISTDGRITQWSMKKGLEFMDLMKLKRVASSSKAKDGKSEAFISRRGSGLCFDFSAKDPNIYLAGTEDGNIHKCSCSYSEQYLENYFSHSGPVYRVKWSPYVQDAFLSCSADWAMKLWHHEDDQPRLTFQSGNDYVTDIAWSPSNSTVFGSVTADGRVEIWDLQVSPIDPVVKKTLPQKMTCVLFSSNSPVVVTGDNSGCVNVFKLTGFDPPDIAEEDQIHRLEKAMSPDALPGVE